MADERVDAPRAEQTLTVTVSAEPALFDTVGAVAQCLGEHAGCLAAEATGFGEAVRLTLDRTIVAAPPDAVPVELEVVFQAAARWLRADVSCGRTRQGRIYPLEQAMVAGEGLAGLQSKVDRVEVVQDQGRACCRLTRQIRPR